MVSRGLLTGWKLCCASSRVLSEGAKKGTEGKRGHVGLQRILLGPQKERVHAGDERGHCDHSQTPLSRSMHEAPLPLRYASVSMSS